MCQDQRFSLCIFCSYFLLLSCSLLLSFIFTSSFIPPCFLSATSFFSLYILEYLSNLDVSRREIYFMYILPFIPSFILFLTSFFHLHFFFHPPFTPLHYPFLSSVHPSLHSLFTALSYFPSSSLTIPSLNHPFIC